MAGDANPRREPPAPRDRRQGRGHLSSFDMLPDEAEEALAWAAAALRDREMPQTEILRQFNAMLADKGIKGVSKSAFSRYSVRAAIEARKLEASRKIPEAVLSRLAPKERTDSTLAAIELLKYRILEQVTAEEDPNPKLLLNATLALQRLSTTALREAEGLRRESADQREQDDRERQAVQDQAASEAADEATEIAREAGLSAEHIAAIRKGVLGLSA